MLRIKNSLLFLVLLIAASNFFVLDLYAQAPPDPESLARRHCIGLSDLDSDPETPSVLDPESPA